MMLEVGLYEHAGRTAYLAGYHAAQAVLFEKTEKIFKTHKGVQAEFSRLVKDDPRFGRELRSFLGRTYELKTIADYEVGSAPQVTAEQAAEAIAAARMFVARLVELVGD